MHKYIAFNDPAQALRFLDLYARKAQDVAVQPRLETVLGNLENAGYSDDIVEYDMNNPASVAQFAVSSLIRDMKGSNLPPYPQAVENKKRLYFQSSAATQSLDA